MASAGGSATICNNETAIVSGASASNGAILWTVNAAGSITLGATTLTPTYTAATGDAGNSVILTMTVKSSNSCGTATASAIYTVNVKSNTSTPLVTSPLCAGATTVNGTSNEADGTSIEVFKGATSLEIAIVNGGIWNKSVTALSIGDVITAKATAIGKCLSDASNSVTVAVTSMCTSYSGDYFANTGTTTTGGSATVTLKYNILTDVTAACSNISGLTVGDFKITVTSQGNTIGSVTLVAGSASYSGGIYTAKYTIALTSTGYSGSVLFELGLNNTNFSINGNCSDNPVVTVSTNSAGFVTGGGYILPANSGGTIGGTLVNGLKNNFGFNIKSGNSGRLQGNWNTIIRRRENGQVVNYQVKSNNASSLVITKISATSYRADMTFTSANFQNLTCPLCPVNANNGTVLVSVYDNGEPGAGVDKILITIKDKNGNVWYTSDVTANHNVTYSNLQLLNQGNIQVHTLGTKAGIRIASLSDTQIGVIPPLNDFNLKALPNPSVYEFKLQVQSRSHEKMQLRVTDISGRTVEEVRYLSAGQTIRLGAAYQKGIYFVELSQGNNRQQIKLVKL